MFDNHYGTPRAPVEAALSEGQDVLFDIDWQGTQQLREKARADVINAYNFARRLKTLKGLTPYEYICKCWTSQPERLKRIYDILAFDQGDDVASTTRDPHSLQVTLNLRMCAVRYLRGLD